MGSRSSGNGSDLRVRARHEGDEAHPSANAERRTRERLWGQGHADDIDLSENLDKYLEGIGGTRP